MTLDVPRLARRLEATAELIRATVVAADPEERVWRPPDGGWTVLEIVSHLLDEEREDFPVRLELVLRDPEAPWPPIDPEGWVTSRGYGKRDLDETLEAFLAERRRSLEWLAALGDADFTRSRAHPVAGSIAGGDLLASWLAHDVLHLRQLARRRFQYTSFLVEPFSTRYAGAW